MKKDKIIVLGYGGHSQVIADTIISGKEYDIEGYIEKNSDLTDTCQGKIIGTDDDISLLHDSGIQYAAMGIGCIKGGTSTRENVYLKAKESGMIFPVIIDNSAILADSVDIKEGTYIGKRVVANTGARIGKLCIINTGAIIEHNVVIGDFTHVSVGAIICGDVTIGRNCMIGAGAVIKNGINIGDNVTVGIGAVVTKDILEGRVVVGNPAVVKEKKL